MKILALDNQNGKNFLTIQTGSIFLAIPITDKGIVQLKDDIEEIFKQREQEILSLETNKQ